MSRRSLRNGLVGLGVASALIGLIALLGDEPAREVAALAVALEPSQDEPQAPKQLWTCGMHPQVLRDEPGSCPICGMALTPVRGDDGEHAAHRKGRVDAVSIDPVMVQRMGVRVAEVEMRPLQSRIRLAGYLGEAEPRRYDVNLRVSGWVEKLYANTDGQHVVRGEGLFELYSPEVRIAVEELIAAERAPANRTGGVVGRAAREKLRLFGLDEREIARLARLPRAPRTVRFTSPIEGHVVEKRLVEGAKVESGMRALRIVDHSVLWLDAQVFEQDLPLVRLGQEVQASLVAQPGKRITGKVSFVHPHVDPMTRTATVRIEVPNPDLSLRPGMYGTVEIAAADQPVLQVPRGAVIDTGERQLVFVSLGDGGFEPRQVKIGRSGSDGAVEVKSGLAEGERIVTSGQFLLDAESRFREAIAKYRSEGLLGSPSGASVGPSEAAPPTSHVH
jgi:multidrug efflux pump subunit AcrA (membrane-fusion protein)